MYLLMPMNLYTTRLRLTEFSTENIADIHRLHRFPEVARFNTIGIPQNEAVTHSLLQPVLDDQQAIHRKRYGWAIALKENDTFIGEAGMILSAPKYNSAEIYYNLLPKFWKQGYASETVQTILQFGFASLQLHRIEAGVATENTASIRVLEKAGLSREGLHRKILPLVQGWTDNYHYAILESEWGKVKN